MLLSIGGWTYSPNFAVPASTVAGKAEFVRSGVALVEDYGLDGLDLDWEYPATPAQARDYVELLKALREGLDRHAAAKGVLQPYQLTIAAPCGPDNYERMLLREMDQYLTFWNLMSCVWLSPSPSSIHVLTPF